MSVVSVPASHYRVVCARCRKDAYVCPERDGSIEAWGRAVRAFRRAGWHCDVPALRQPKAQQAAAEMGEGRWYCPDCASVRP